MQPPEMIEAGDVVLRRWTPEMAGPAAAAIRESLPELAAFMPWATDAYDAGESRDFISRSAEKWDNGTEFNYAIFVKDSDDLAGSIGLMTRMGAGTLEIGYWMRTSQTGRGYMTAAVEALSRVALTLPGVERLAIRQGAR
jgi:ribosomal-protein-serine acetyltransferase